MMVTIGTPGDSVGEVGGQSNGTFLLSYVKSSIISV